MEIGIALSGGGVRALVFHLGVIERLARSKQVEDIQFISSVSGGSLAAGLVFSLCNYMKPTSIEFQQVCVPGIRDLITSYSLQVRYGLRRFQTPWNLLWGRAYLLGKTIETLWGIKGTLSQLPKDPAWAICATTFETGKNWTFTRDSMGDYKIGRTQVDNTYISTAIAASAGFPGLIGPLVMKQMGKSDKVHLWDGGVYDNLGLEPLYKPGVGSVHAGSFVIASDAGALDHGVRRSKIPVWSQYRSTRRLIDISMEQVRALRCREFVAFLKTNPSAGALLRIGNSVEYILKKGGKTLADYPGSGHMLSDEQVEEAASIATSLEKLSEQQFDLLFQHGYEVADATLGVYAPASFPFHPF